jgi:probable HAF family extracellular repeat protein
MPVGVAVDESDQKVYWTDGYGRRIQRAELFYDGGATNVEDLITSGLVEPQDIAVDPAGGKMYWVDSGVSKIQRANLDGTDVEDLITTGLQSPFGIALDAGGGKMYWTDPGAGKVQRAGFDGGGPEDVVIGLEGPMGIDVDPVGGKVYWANAAAGKIQRCNLDGAGGAEDLVTDLFTPVGLCLTATRMYWIDVEARKMQSAYMDGTQVHDYCSSRYMLEPFLLTWRHSLYAPVWTEPLAHTIRMGCYSTHGSLRLGGPESRSFGVNDSCWVAGHSNTVITLDPDASGYPGGLDYAFLYRDDEMVNLGALGGLDDSVRASRARAINNSGDVVGWSDTPPAGSGRKPLLHGYDHAFLYSYSTGEMADLGTLSGESGYSYAYDLNDFGEVAGYSFTGTATHAFFWDEFSGLTDLGTLGGLNSHAYAINSFGHVVGRSQTDSGANHAFLYIVGVMLDLGTLGGGYSQAWDINDAVMIVGESWTEDGESHAFLRDGPSMIDLGTLGGEDSVAYAINASGQVVGESQTVGGEVVHAFLYRDGVMTDLNDFLPEYSRWNELLVATDINDAGAIVGQGDIGGRMHAFLLRPAVPGDLDCDGLLTNDDIPAFVRALSDPEGYATAFQDCDINLADMNWDDAINGADVRTFVDALLTP